MGTFKIGDRVKATNGYPTDKVGVVRGVTRDGSYAVEFEGWTEGHGASLAGLSLGESGWHVEGKLLEPAFSVGDRVTFTADFGPGKGTKGTVRKLGGIGDATVSFEGWDGGHDGDVGLTDSSGYFVTFDQIEPAPDFAVGDRVTFTDACDESWFFGPDTNIKGGTIANLDDGSEYLRIVVTTEDGSAYVEPEHIVLAAAVDDDWDYDPRKAGNDNSLKIEAGKFYRTRDGRKVGPARPNKEVIFTSSHPWRMGDDGMSYKPNGGWSIDDDVVVDDIVAEWVAEAPASKFKVGDRVVRTNGFYIDVAGTVTEVDATTGYYTIVWDNRPGNSTSWQDHELGHAPVVVVAEPTPHIVAVFRCGKPAPATRPVVHDNAEAATAEAERLARTSPGEVFGVFALVAKRIADVTVRAA